MTLLTRRSVTTGLATAAMAVTLASPLTAHADIVDDALAKLPSGPITCEQANQYWTNEADFNSKRTQALAVAPFHPRGGEIRAAIGRIDEAADRCGLRGGGAPAPSNPAPARPSNPAPSNPAPAPQAPVGQVIAIPVAPGTPTVTIPVGGAATIVAPDVAKIIADFLAQFTGGAPALGSSL